MAKKTAKTKSKPKKNEMSFPAPEKNTRTEVSTEKVQNGYIVSSMDENWNRKSKVAKTKAEAKKYAQQMMKF